MKVHNVRSPEQWEIISRHIDFEGKTVLDLGCGKGDILFRAFEAGAKVLGIDKDHENVKYVQEVCPDISIMQGDLSWLLPFFSGPDAVNIAICFSVLPYLVNPSVILQWINRYSDIALIECQYAGDGPGPSFLKGNNDMRAWLLEAGQFEKVQVIGHTFVEGRNKNRFIWMCE